MSCLDDNDVVSMVEGTLPPERLREVEAHLDECSACRQLVAASAKSPGEVKSEGGGASASGAGSQQLGRYTVLKPVGAGAMGVVYAAYDPVLDRRVALKLLHAAGAAPSETVKLKTRLLREAQAMARLSHPNVIAVHDVGTVNDQVFVAMEFVEGCTLSQWIARKHPWREVLRVFVLAGRGLAAAHAAGLVHRDFKPDNVLIGDDGQVRVTDFGLARAEVRAATVLPESPVSGAATRGNTAPVSTGSLSVQGALVGSPAYMAPEQLRGETVDARADQFSFCVALYEAIYGERPYAGRDLLELRAAIDAGPRPEPSSVRLPKWVRRVLQRGLASRPADRFTTLDVLLDALEADPAASRRQLLIGIAAIALLAGAVGLVRWQAARAERGCRGAEEKVSAVFTPELREKARAAFAASKLSYAQDGWTRAEQALDQYGAEWAKQRTDACESTAVRKEQSPELLDLRMACLDDRLRDLSATAKLFADSDPEVIAHASQISASLPALAPCADARALRDLPAPLPQQASEVNGARDQLAQLRVLILAGKRVELFPFAQQVADRARATGYGPVEAEALYSLGLARLQTDDLKAAREAFLAASAAGLRARVDAVIADSWTKLIVVCIQLSLREETAQAAMFARAAVARLNGNAGAQAQLEIALGMIAELDAKMDEQQAHIERAVALLEPLPHGPAYLAALDQLAFIDAQRARLPEALEIAQRLLALATAQLGPNHISVGEKQGLVGDVLARMGRHTEAAAYFDRAASIIEAADGASSLLLVDVLRERSANAGSRRLVEQSIADAQRALKIVLERLGPGTIDEAVTRGYIADALLDSGRTQEAGAQYALAVKLFDKNGDQIGASDGRCATGRILLAEGKLEAARKLAEEALRVDREKLPPDHPIYAQTLLLLGRISMKEHKLSEARRDIGDAAAMMRRSLGEVSETWHTEVWLAQVDVESGDAPAASARLEKIQGLVHSTHQEEFDDTWLRVLLARTLWMTKKDPQRARQMLAEADRDYTARGLGSADDLAEVRKLEKQLAQPPP